MNEKVSEKTYFLGIDIGTDSVGYAATDESYSLLKFHGEPVWGVSLFDAAALNTERRTFRTARRRLDRRQQRVRLLSELFAAEIGKVDEKFFIRLKDSALYPEDKEEPGSLFGTEGYTDADYHREYPTIHHLIAELMKDDPAHHDVRLVYLACAWLVAHRGHFLNEIESTDIDKIIDFRSVWEDFFNAVCEGCETPPWQNDPETMKELGDILKKKVPVTVKYRSLCGALFGANKAPADGAEWNLELLLKLLCGSKVDAAKLFRREEYKDVGSFTLNDPEENLARLFAQLGDDALLIKRAKAVFDWSLLADSLGGYRSISEAKVAVYDKHKKDLRFLKKFVRKYLPEKYDEIFRELRENNYTAYSYHYNNKAVPDKKIKKADKEDFSKYLLGLISKTEPEEADRTGWEKMRTELETCAFLPKQRDGDNRVIPHQLYEKELTDILVSAERYLPFLTEKDAEGRTTSEKIRAIFSFRIPYFVGPLNRHSERAWFRLLPGASGPLLPWNFTEKIDEAASEEEFIRKMTNKCTYLPDEDVVPKNSLLYTSFTVLNALNSLKIDGKKLPVPLKQQMYNELFLCRRKVTKKRAEDFLRSINALQEGQELTGIDQTFKSSLAPWHDFKNLMKGGVLSATDVEKIIQRRTYSEEKGRFVKWLEKEYPGLSKEDRKYVADLTYKDFGRLSRAFLTETYGVDRKTGTGEAFSIMNGLWNTEWNLMELLSENFTFRETVDARRKAYYSEHPLSPEERMDEMYLSNAVKRPVIRSLAIVREVTKAVGCPPAKIFVEMTRGATEEQKNKRTVSRKNQILELYKKCDDEDVRLLREELEKMGDEAESRLQSETLFLYFTQLGRCMYTRERIDLKNLGNDKFYNRDHIWPRSLIKDDSTLNNKVLVTSESNGRKGDNYPVPAEIRRERQPFWARLKALGLITEEKYRRLTRSTPFTDEEKLGFINRQLTETSQSTKAAATLLKEYYPDTEIVYVKARLTSEFRQTFDLLKSRTFNDLHHAKDAYLNIVTGNVYDMKFSKRWFSLRDEYSMKTEVLFTKPVRCGEKIVWDGKPMLTKVKKTVEKNNAHLVRYAFCREGGLFDQQPLKKAPGLIPRKAGLPTEKYGGYNKPAVCFFVLTRYRIGKKSDIMVLPVELMHKEAFLTGGEAAENYAKQRLGRILSKSIDEVSFPLGRRILKINTMLSLDGFRVCITGSSNGGRSLSLSPHMPFSADRKTETYLKRLEVLTEKAKNPHFIYHPEYDRVTAEENLALYDLYLKKLSDSIYTKRPNNQLETVQNGRAIFAGLSPVEQAKALLNLHQVFGRIAGGCDLTLIGGSAHSAATNNFSAALSNWKKYYKEVRIIDPSSAGLWEKRSENLLELL